MNYQRKIHSSEYIMFIDESGVSHLNHSSRYFVLATVIIDKKDFLIIEGYLRLLKRKFLGNDLINIHFTDMCERTYRYYRRLIKPSNHINSFLQELLQILKTIPYKVGIYYVDKNKLRNSYGYTPGRRKQIDGVNMDKPYELCAKQAFIDSAVFLNTNKCFGEIHVESRSRYDGNLVSYLEEMKESYLSGNMQNPNALFIKKRINSLTISNKGLVNGGLEIADIAAYTNGRKLGGDPNKVVKVPTFVLIAIAKIIRSKAYVFGAQGRKIIEIT